MFSSAPWEILQYRINAILRYFLLRRGATPLGLLLEFARRGGSCPARAGPRTRGEASEMHLLELVL